MSACLGYVMHLFAIWNVFSEHVFGVNAEDKVSVFENSVLVKSRPRLGKTHDFTRFNRQLLIGFLINFEVGFLNRCSSFGIEFQAFLGSNCYAVNYHLLA